MRDAMFDYYLRQAMPEENICRVKYQKGLLLIDLSLFFPAPQKDIRTLFKTVSLCAYDMQEPVANRVLMWLLADAREAEKAECRDLRREKRIQGNIDFVRKLMEKHRWEEAKDLV